MTIKPIISIIIGALLLIVAIFFVGIYRDPEFPSEVTTFIKYRPTPQFEFVDYEAGDNHHPTAEMEQQTIKYYDFLEHKPADFSPLLLQAMLTFFILGIVYRKAGRNVPLSNIVVHYICSVLLIVFGLGYLSHFYDNQLFILVSILILAANLLIAVLLTRKLYTIE